MNFRFFLTFFTHTLNFIQTAFHRLINQKGLALANLLGITAAVSLVLGISLYSDAVYYQTFLDNIAETKKNDANQISYDDPTFPFLFHYFGGWHGARSWEDLAPLDKYLSTDAIPTLGVPLRDYVRLISTDTLLLFPTEAATQVNTLFLSRSSLSSMNNLEAHINLVSGHFPTPSDRVNDQPFEILIHKNLAERANVKVGQTYVTHFSRNTTTGDSVRLPVIIAGIWEAKDPGEDYWIFNASFYENLLFVPEDTFFARAAPFLNTPVYNAYWYLIMDGDYVHADSVGRLLGRIGRVERESNQLVKNLWLSVSPIEALQNYQRTAQTLKLQLYAFSLPIIGLIAAFINLVARLSIQRRRLEIAVLRSRGATIFQVLGLTILEGAFLGILGLGFSIPLATKVVEMLSETAFSLAETPPIRLSFSSGSIVSGIGTIILVILAMAFPTYQAARHTIVSYKQEEARALGQPWWQRAWLDLLLFIPAVYGAYLLQVQGRVAVISPNGENDPFQNPLLFLVPALAILSFTLFSLRLVQPFMRIFAYLGGWTRGIGFVLATRKLSRAPGAYHTPLLILTLTTSLLFYTSSLTNTIDRHLFDQAYYRVGADAQFLDAGEYSRQWHFFPVSEYTKLDGIINATRMGRYEAQVRTGRLDVEGMFLGVDRLDLPKTIFWRNDFAMMNLGALMNALAAAPDGVLVHTDFLKQGSLDIGDQIEITVTTYDQTSQWIAPIVGTYDLFPTWYPGDPPYFIGNLDYLFELAGGIYPYQVLLRAEPESSVPNLDDAILGGLDVRVRYLNWETPGSILTAIQESPERRGTLGFLLFGITVSTALTVFSFLLHMLFTFRQRTIELGVLRASGLSILQMGAFMFWEFIFLVALGGFMGTLFGWSASSRFIPYLQIGVEQALIPPFFVRIAWETILQSYILLGILFVAVLLLLMLLLRRMRIFQAVKLGETV